MFWRFLSFSKELFASEVAGRFKACLDELSRFFFKGATLAEIILFADNGSALFIATAMVAVCGLMNTPTFPLEIFRAKMLL